MWLLLSLGTSRERLVGTLVTLAGMVLVII